MAALQSLFKDNNSISLHFVKSADLADIGNGLLVCVRVCVCVFLGIC